MVDYKRYKLEIIFVAVFLAVLVFDQLIKYFVYVFRPEINLKILSIHFVQNTGAGFGILKSQTGMLAVISLIVAMAVIFFYRKIPREAIPQFLFALFLGGVFGNLVDRVFRSSVIDFIDFGFWPAFNIADVAISVSVIGMIVYFWKK